MNKTITAQNAPAAVGPYCHAKQAGNTLYTSGQLGLDPATGKLERLSNPKYPQEYLRDIHKLCAQKEALADLLAQV